MSSNSRTGWVVTGLTLLAWCAVPRTEAQPGPPPIRLSAGGLIAADGVDRALATAAPISLRTGPLHFIIQFEGRPSNRDRDVLAALGIRLLDPIPVNAYFAVATPPIAQPTTLLPGGPLDGSPYRAVVLVPARYKLTPSLEGALRGQPVPPHADRGNGRIAATVRFHSDVPVQDRVTALRDLGVTIETPDPIRELQVGIEVVVPITDLLRVAGHDRIRSIDYIELEGEDDNDTVRSAEGADSDAVVAAYDVTGADVVIGQFESGVAGPHKDLSRLDVADTGVTKQSVHATHVAGTLIGDGTLNSQWRGVATGARILAYDDKNRQSEYLDAIDNHGLIATNTSWDSTYCHRISTAAECYDNHSQFYDEVISGRTTLGGQTGLPRRILFVGSAGNLGAPERHADDVVPNGRYDPNETIYEDIDDDGKVGLRDRFKGIGTNYNASSSSSADVPLINFALNERHDDLHNNSMGYGSGAFESVDLSGIDEVVYRDLDDSLDVSVGDTRLSGPMAGSHVLAGDPDVNIQVGDVRLVTTSAGPAGSVVAAGDADISIPERYLRQFRPWGSVRLQNSAKNTITVGSYLAGYGTLDPESGRGPTTDGRLKPDLVAPGSQYDGEGGVTSTVPVDAYNVDHGTSMAAPVVTGVAAMLIQWYRLACAEGDPKPSTLRAVLLHSATDLKTIPNYNGVFAGPDYAYGYGAVNAPSAMTLMPHHREGVATEADLGDPDAHTFQVTVGATPRLKVTLAWDDAPWTAGDARDPTTGLLHNDLDLELVAPNGKIYTPWRLDPANPGVPAVASPGFSAGAVPDDARDRRNTVEQIVIANAVSGTWTIRVLASTLNRPDQDFSVVSDFLEPADGAPCSATPSTDVWVQDDPTGEGVGPSATPWLSLDVWNDNDDTEGPSGAAVNDDPTFDEVNDLYVRLRNRSTEEAKGSSVDVWAAPASTAPLWPNDFEYVGRLAAPHLPGRESRVFGPLEWVPRRQSPSNQLTYYVRVTNPRDPFPAAVLGAAQSDNIALRNVHDIDLREGTRFIAFEIGSPTATLDRQPRAVDLVLSVTSRSRDLPITARLLLDPDVEQRWLAAGAPATGFTVPTDPTEAPALRSQTARLRLTIDPRARQERLIRAAISSRSEERNPVVLDVVQCVDERVTGGIRYVLHAGTPRPLRGSELRPPAWINARSCSPPVPP